MVCFGLLLPSKMDIHTRTFCNNVDMVLLLPSYISGGMLRELCRFRLAWTANIIAGLFCLYLTVQTAESARSHLKTIIQPKTGVF